MRRRTFLKGLIGTTALVAAPTIALQAGLTDSEYINVLDYGAVGDGFTDDTAMFQRAIDAVSQRGGVVFVPPGNYNADVRALFGIEFRSS